MAEVGYCNCVNVAWIYHVSSSVLGCDTFNSSVILFITVRNSVVSSMLRLKPCVISCPTILWNPTYKENLDFACYVWIFFELHLLHLQLPSPWAVTFCLGVPYWVVSSSSGAYPLLDQGLTDQPSASK